MPLLLFAFDRFTAIHEFDKIQKIYQKRLECLKKNEAPECIEKYPQDTKSDALARTFCMAFPKSYYAAKLKRDIDILEKKKLCIGRSQTEVEAKKCLKTR
jgi:hypothetical protein